MEVNGQDINSIWNCLGVCWKELAELRHWTIDSTEAEEVRRFMHSWQASDLKTWIVGCYSRFDSLQIYIFECCESIACLCLAADHR